MKILQVHNFYQQPGGEDQVCAAEFDVLTRNGHVVEQYLLHNDAIQSMSPLAVAARTIWSRQAFAETRALIRQFRPDVVHCHNTFPLISPAVYYAASAERVPVVQALQNYRLICPSATLFRDGRVCHDCVGHFVPYPAVRHACYRGSRAASATVAGLLTVHRASRTWQARVQRYVAASKFVKDTLAEGGLPEHKISVKPNFVSQKIAPGSGAGGFALYVGRLAEEKGIRTLLSAWELLPDVPLRIVGDGPLRSLVESYRARVPQMAWLGYCPREDALEQMRAASFLVVTSQWYEGLPMTVLEEMACGTPVVASDIGSLPEAVLDDVTGLRFPSGDAAALAATVRRLLEDPHKLARLRQSTRSHYETNFTPERNYQQLLSIYRQARSDLYA